jgi:plastocyanin
MRVRRARPAVRARVAASCVVVVVLLLVLALAACGGGGGGGSARYQQPPGPAEETLSIDAGNFYFDPENPSIPAGTVVELEIVGREGLHTLVFDDNKVPGFHLEVTTGRTDSLRLRLPAGRYVFYCDIPGHRAQGMEGTLTVR